MESGPIKTKTDIIFERIPPILGLILFLFPFVTSYIAPKVAAYFIILLNIYFFYKSLTYALQFGIVLIKLRQANQISWKEKVEGLKNITSEIDRIKLECEFINNVQFSTAKKDPKFRQYKSFPNRLPVYFQRYLFNLERSKTLRYLHNELDHLSKLENFSLTNPDELQHIVIIPFVKEPIEMLRGTLRCIANQTFPTNQINVVLAAEAVIPGGVGVARELRKEFNGIFNNIWITNHILQDNEIAGKSPNMAWAGKYAAREIKKLGWDFSKVTVTSCDADSKLPSPYFSYVSYQFITDPDGKYKFFNGAMVFYNNIWKLPFYIRVKNSMSTIYSVGRLIRTDKLIPFSTYTASLFLIDSVGYWTPWITPEDYHMFFKSLMKFPRKVGVIPIYLQIMSDAADGVGHWATIKNNYFQERRWAWGISDDGWLMKTIVFNWTKYSLRVKYMAIHTIFDHVMGPVGSFLVLIGGNIPTIINPNFSNSVLGVLLPGVSSFVISLTLFFMFTVVFLDFFLKPRRKNESIYQIVGSLLEWLIQPVAGFFLSILPGLEAHSRLLFGQYLEYYVTKKSVDESVSVDE